MALRCSPTVEPISILIVEDSAVQAEELRSLLIEEGANVQVAREGTEALRKAEAAPPALVICDIVMPGMDGYEVCRRLKAMPATADVPVMLLTDLSDPIDIIRGLECGADNFTTKPYDTEQLVSRINFIFLNRRLRQNGTAAMGLEVHFGGKRHLLSPERMQVLDLLLGSFETAVTMNKRLAKANRELQNALGKIRELEGLLPVCSYCGQVRNDHGAWQKIEEYVKERGLRFTHGLCPDCLRKLYPEEFGDKTDEELA